MKLELETLKKIIADLDRLNCQFVAVHQLQHPDDHYLQVVLARRRHDNTYITWMHNSDCGGMFWGHYDMTLEKAKADFASRILKGK